MSRPLAGLCLVTVLAACAGCGAREYEGAQRYPLSGNVTVDGEPMEMGVISFLPLDKEQGRVSGAPIRNGTYSIPEARGANAGKYRIEIHWNKPTGRRIPNPMDPEELMDEMVDGQYQKDSELTADVGPDRTTFNFDLKSK